MTFHQHPTTYTKHVHLKVADVSRSTIFYENILGLRILEQTKSIVRFTTNGQDAILTIEQPIEVSNHAPNAAGLYHMAFLLPSKKDLGSIFNHIRSTGYPFSGASDHLVSEALYLNDIDGNGIELYYDRSPDVWKWQSDMVEMTVDPLDIEGLVASAEQTSFTAMPEGTVMGHVHLRVANLADAETFYVQGLGFDVVSRYGTQATFISSNGYHHHIALNTWGHPSSIKRSEQTLGLKSFSIVYPDDASRQQVVKQLNEIGASVFEQIDYIGAIDPSGVEVQLFVGK
ncbi:VOC family protein [Paenisporosarcina quisquiliarum]|uniref:VOC family protein n=1 Tax=Paenisporosarcina quisquiliarum TaxID=365346 RepID=A0A9X3LK50_9BACL|nr:VOC family protein [Paenisporosarcina quisquiliarum]MCZ8538264.1 VOC family protein [Paenisporosarcina quisquiliarum]